MKPTFVLPTLVIILSLAWQANAQAQQADTSKVGSPVGRGLEQLQTMAEKGDPDAQYQLAERYRIGFPVEQDYDKALELYKLSAGQGFASSQFRLGELYEEGEILERDLGKAIESYRPAADQGHAGAQYALAHIYHLGSGVPQDMAAAMDWYRKAALQGDEWSQLALGDQYRIGLAVPRDLAQSTSWYRKAADKGNMFAQYELGNAYRYGNGVDPDMAKAIAWYSLSAEAGNPSAQLTLAELELAGTAATRVTAPATAPHAMQGAGPDGLADGPEGDRVHSETDMEAVAEEKAATPPAVPEEAPQVAASAPPDSAAARETELAFAAPPRVRDEVAVAQLLALAEDQMARLALTTPAGGNAYDTYQQVLSIEPDNAGAFDGIEQIGVKYVGLAGLAAAKGDLERARHYAARATELAPEHPLVRSMTLPQEAAPLTTDEKTEPPELLVNTNSPRRAAPATNEAKTKIEGATPASAAATPGELIEDANDLIFKPDDYQDRQVTVAGSVVHFLGLYRLKSETGQNSIVIGVNGLSQSDRARLDTAIDKAGFLGQVKARIKGRIERQKLVTFQLAATELTLIGTDQSKDEVPGQSLDPAHEEGVAPVASIDPSESSVQTNDSNDRSQWSEPERAGAITTNSGGGGQDEASVGKRNSPESQSPGNGGGTGGASSGGSSHSAAVAAPVYYQPESTHVPTCYQDMVWRRLPDGRIQTGIRTRCY